MRRWRGPLALLLLVAGAGCTSEPPHFLFAIGGSAVSAFTIDAKTGALRTVAGSPFAVPEPVGAATVSRSGRMLYLGHRGQRAVMLGSAAAPGRISGYAVDARGALTPVSGSPVTVDGDVDSLAAPPPGRFLYATSTTWVTEHRVTTGARAISIHAIDDTTGALGPASTQTLAHVRAFVIDAQGRFAHAVRFGAFENRDDEILTFTLDGGTGALSARGAGTPLGSGERPVKLVIAPSGGRLYALLPPKSVPHGPGAEQGRQAYGWISSVSAYAIDATGALTAVPDSSARVGASGYSHSLAFAPSGKFLYVADPETPPLPVGGVWAYRVDETTGGLTPVSGSPVRAGTDARAIVVDRSGRFVYVASRSPASGGPGSIWAYNIDQGSGALTPVPGSPFTTPSATSVLLTTGPGR
jgi:6-phosphogluconolactonase (cycloisomerase 2 family)